MSDCQHEWEWRRIERKRPTLCGIPNAGIHIENWWFCKHCDERLLTEAEKELNARFLKNYNELSAFKVALRGA